MAFDLRSLTVGDYVEVQIVNKSGDRNLDRVILKGTVKDTKPALNMARLHTGWCIHTKDRLLVHRTQRSEDDE